MNWQAKLLCPGEAAGEVLRFTAPISFWGGVNPQTAEVSLDGHPQQGSVISDKILVIPFLIGSSSSSAILLELLYRHIAPRALVLGGEDAILPVGVLVAEQMGWSTIPVMMLKDPPFLSGDQISIRADGQIIALPKNDQFEP